MIYHIKNIIRNYKNHIKYAEKKTSFISFEKHCYIGYEKMYDGIWEYSFLWWKIWDIPDDHFKSKDNLNE